MKQTTGTPIVAAVMATYNHASLASQTVESVLAQTLDAWELIVIDDGSTDGTPNIVRGYHDPRIRVNTRANEGLGGLGNPYRAALESSPDPLVAFNGAISDCASAT